MNERIKQLWTQAGGDYSSGNQHDWPYARIDNPESFAELIVKECVSIVAKRKDLAIDDGWNVDEAMTVAEMDLERYFGVK